MDFLKSSETDVAYYILNLANKPIFFKDLILEVIEKKCKPVQSLSASIAEVYTLINMDGRFQYTGMVCGDLLNGIHQKQKKVVEYLAVQAVVN